MPRQIIVRPEASADAMQAAQWYDQHVTGLGTRSLEQLSELMAGIGQSPGRYPSYYRDIHKARVESFPYGVFFAVTEKQIVVLAIIHLHRDPRFIRRTL